MSYARNKRKKMKKRERKYPQLFIAGVPIVSSWNVVEREIDRTH